MNQGSKFRSKFLTNAQTCQLQIAGSVPTSLLKLRLFLESVFMTEITSNAFVLEHYEKLIEHSHPEQVKIWPLISGYDCKSGQFQDWWVIIFIHTGNSGTVTTYGLGELPQSLIGSETITFENKELARSRIEKHFALRPQDGVVFMRADSLENSELMALMHRHEIAFGLAPMKIFLSHKGFNKPLVRQFKTTLALLGFDPWLDEEAMPAGTNLKRGILNGFTDSCAAVFFITPEFRDESFLATEVDYPIKEKRVKKDRFAIITLVIGDGTVKGKVPDLLHGYVWKEPKSELEALQEIIRALPIHVGDVRWR